MWGCNIPPASKKGMNRGALLVLHREVAVTLIGFREKYVVEHGERLFIAQGETSISICMIKIQSGALGDCGRGNLGSWLR